MQIRRGLCDFCDTREPADIRWTERSQPIRMMAIRRNGCDHRPSNKVPLRTMVARVAFTLGLVLLVGIGIVVHVRPDGLERGNTVHSTARGAIVYATSRSDAVRWQRPALGIDSSASSGLPEMCMRWDERDCGLLHRCATVVGEASDGEQAELRRICSCYNASTRVVPRVFLIGCQKCGSTSLHTGMIGHSQIVEARDVTRMNRDTKINIGIAGKELHYFDNLKRFGRGFQYYLCHFPTVADGEERRVTIDSTPDYIWMPWVPRNIKETYRAHGLDTAELRFIVILRDPLERLLSWYNMSRNAGWLMRHGHCTEYHLSVFGNDSKNAPGESLVCDGTFESAVNEMMRALDDCVTKLSSAPGDDASGGKLELRESMYAHVLLHRDWETIFTTCVIKTHEGMRAPDGRGTGRVERDVMLEALLNGLYAHQLRHWLTYFNAEQMFVTTLDSYSKNATALMENVLDFIGVDEDAAAQDASSFRMNAAGRDRSSASSTAGDPLFLTEQTRARLCALYHPFIRDTGAMLDTGQGISDGASPGRLHVFDSPASVSSWCGGSTI